MSEPLLSPPAHADNPALGLLAVGIDHHCASLELRERVALSRPESEALLQRLQTRHEIAEAFVLSTCNRTEVYLRPREQEGAFRVTMELTFNGKAPEVERDGRFWVLRDGAAAHHLLAVAAGLESMVLGEPEILGQVRRAAELARATGTSGLVLERLLRAALHTGGRARGETAIGEGAVSLGYAVVELARHIFIGLEGRSCLLLGGGETATMAARALVERGLSDVRFAVRGVGRYQGLREELPTATVTELADRYATLADCDLLVAATAADEPVVEAGEVRQVMRRRRSRPLLVVDLGVPRNVAPEVGKLGNVFLHDLDSLRHLIERNLEQRRAEVPRVEAIVGEELDRFVGWSQGKGAEPLIAELQRRAERIRREEVERAASHFPPELQDELDRLTRSLVRKILHHPSTRLRTGTGERALAHLELARDLFQLGEGEEGRP
jgi:glutamyl-tRNA reductase